MPALKDPQQKILKALKKTYPQADCALSHKNPWQLLMATILSAQCTDERVNKVTPVLFQEYPTPHKMAQAALPDVEAIVRSTGFFRQKAKSLVFTSRDLVEKFGGDIPKDINELTKLRGVARKTANVVLGTGYGIASGVVVDTHVRRLSNRLGFTRQQDPVKIEKDLVKILPQSDWIWFSHGMITHGRQVCRAQTPHCPKCVVKTWCPYFKKNR